MASASNPPRGEDAGALSLRGSLVVDPAIVALLPKGRATERVPVRLGAGLRRRGSNRLEVEILDLSTEGFRAEAWPGFVEGMELWLRLPGLESLQARTVWVDGARIGCAFVRPLHPAVLALIVSRA